MLPVNCPRCGFSFRGEEIPDDLKDAYGATHFSLLHGVEVPGVYDGVLYWQDPNCGFAFQRFGEKHYLGAKAQKYIDEVNNVLTTPVAANPG